MRQYCLKMNGNEKGTRKEGSRLGGKRTIFINDVGEAKGLHLGVLNDKGHFNTICTKRKREGALEAQRGGEERNDLVTDE